MSSFPTLLLLGLCLLVTQLCSAEEDLSQITWINALATKAELDEYLKSTHGMASEVLSLKTSKRYRDDKKEVVMGSKPDGLTLAACLEGMKKHKKTKKLFLTVPSLAIYTETVKLLTKDIADGNWITLSLLAFKGANGDDPTWTIDQVNKQISKWPAKVMKFFSMTSKYGGTDGFTREILDKLQNDIESIKEGSWQFGFTLDLFHLAKSELEHQYYMSVILSRFSQYQFFLDPSKVADVDVYKFQEYLNVNNHIPITMSYMNVPDQFRERWNSMTTLFPPSTLPHPETTEDNNSVEPHPTDPRVETVPTKPSGCERIHEKLASIVILAFLIL